MPAEAPRGPQGDGPLGSARPSSVTRCAGFPPRLPLQAVSHEPLLRPEAVLESGQAGGQQHDGRGAAQQAAREYGPRGPPARPGALGGGRGGRGPRVAPGWPLARVWASGRAGWGARAEGSRGPPVRPGALGGEGPRVAPRWPPAHGPGTLGGEGLWAATRCAGRG